MNIYIVDAFTNVAFKGNPAGVCLLDSIQSDQWMQQVASEMNLSETAFLYQEGEGFRLRWFTPLAEVDLCGHATLASAHILWEEHISSDSEISFYTKSGVLKAEKEYDWINLNFPLEIASACTAPTELIEGLGVEFKFVGRNRMDYIVEVASEHIVRNLKPNFSELQKVNTRGIIVSSVSDQDDYDFVSRAFFPALGVNEDPVTGSAHCCLGPYWMEKLYKNELNALQVSERSGILKLNIVGDRIILSGQAVTTVKGVLRSMHE
jgi:PhzF family phenazine biosynthesis protein